MNLSQSRFGLNAALFTLFTLSVVIQGAPFLPADDREVLERLRAVPSDRAAKEVREWRARLAANPENAELAVQLARRCVDRSRSEADPRYLGQAQSALAHWWNAEQPPIDVLILRAVIRQSNHDFTAALVDLEAATRLAPAHPQAWLTRATVLTVLGRFDEARRSCLRLSAVASELIVLTAGSNIAALTGQADRSCQILREALQRNGAAPVGERLWAATVLAETSTRLGRAAEAEAHYRQALGWSRHDPYLLGAFADYLLDQDRPAEVVALLKDEVRIDPLLLRLALAEAALNPIPKELTAHVESLGARFDANRARGNQVHQREQARFALHLLHQPLEALQLAEANWQVQREPADIRIYLESALAASDPSRAAPCLEFVRTNRLEDVKIGQLVSRLNSITLANHEMAHR